MLRAVRILSGLIVVAAFAGVTACRGVVPTAAKSLMSVVPGAISPDGRPVSSADAFALQSRLQRWMTRNRIWQHILCKPNGQLRHTYLIPGAGYYQLFDWDTYFMGLASSYSHGTRGLAGSVEDFLDCVGKHSSYRGYVPRQLTAHHFWSLPEMCKPFLAQMALRVSLSTHSAVWLKPYYSRLAETLSYWRQTRRTPDGLFTWFNGVESGVDNSPAVSSAPANVTEGVDLACYIYREYSAMAVLAEMLHKTSDMRLYAKRAAKLKSLIQTRFWDSAAGTFYNRDSRTGAFIRVPEWTNLTPLWAHVATARQAHILITQHVLNPQEFWSSFGIRSLTPQSPAYDPTKGYWRGPIWIVSDFMLMQGLRHYGYTAEAKLLACRTVAVLLRDVHTDDGMHECYNPNTGAGENQNHFESWDLLGAYMIQEAYKGENPGKETLSRQANQ